MLSFVYGNIFNTNKEVLVNPVNCVGVMGSGLALEFKNRFPNMFRDYLKKCIDYKVVLGEPYYYEEGQTKILNFPTKDHWKNKSTLKGIEEGLEWFVGNYKQLGIKSIAFPALGCGLGGLNFGDVKKLIISYLNKLPIEIDVYCPK